VSRTLGRLPHPVRITLACLTLAALTTWFTAVMAGRGLATASRELPDRLKAFRSELARIARLMEQRWVDQK
jgi:hypothetical protein